MKNQRLITLFCRSINEETFEHELADYLDKGWVVKQITSTSIVHPDARVTLAVTVLLERE